MNVNERLGINSSDNKYTKHRKAVEHLRHCNGCEIDITEYFLDLFLPENECECCGVVIPAGRSECYDCETEGKYLYQDGVGSRCFRDK